MTIISVPNYVFSLPAEQMANSLQRRSDRAFEKQRRKEKAIRKATTAITVFAIVFINLVGFSMVSPADEPMPLIQTTVERNASVSRHTATVRGSTPAWELDIGAQERFARAVEAVAGNQTYECKVAVASCIRTAAEDYGLSLDEVLDAFHYPSVQTASDESVMAAKNILSGESQSPFLTTRPIYCYNAIEEPENWVATQSYVGRIGDLWFYAAPIFD